MIAVLGGLADVERDLIRTRTAEGRSRAKALGQHMAVPLRTQYGHDFEAQDMSAVTLHRIDVARRIRTPA